MDSQQTYVFLAASPVSSPVTSGVMQLALRQNPFGCCSKLPFRPGQYSICRMAFELLFLIPDT
jgi:hypothetical protein